MFKKKV